MITPAQFEDIMKDYQIRMKNEKNNREDIQRKALKDVGYILKQFGYDSGANILEEVMK